MIFQVRKGKNFWRSLYWARDKAVDEVIEVMRGCILALVESGKYQDLPYPIQVSKSIAHLHDAYYQGRKWQYDFDAKFDVAPGKRYTIQTQQAKVNSDVFDFMLDVYSPFKEIPGKNVNWAQSIQCVICNRDIAGAMFAVAEERILQSSATVYPPHYRKLKSHVDSVEATI